MASRSVVVEVPEKVLLASFAKELQVIAAVKLYELGRLSSGRVAELAGMGRVDFLFELKRYKTFPLEAELSELEGDVRRNH